jgi:ribosomal protein S3AE
LKRGVGLSIRTEKIKAIVQNRRTRISRILAIKDHDIEAVRRFKYLGTVINNTDDEQKKSKLES